MHVVLATSNEDKFKEISLILKEFGITTEQFKIDMNETEDTLEDIVLEKAEQAFEKTKKPIIVDDTGFFFDIFDNFPGKDARRVFEEIGYEGLLDKVKDKKRDARFKTLVCFKDGKTIKIFEGVCRGTVTKQVKDVNDRPKFPYEKIFIPEGYEKTVSEMSLEEKIKFSHRAIAIRKFAEFFVKYN